MNVFSYKFYLLFFYLLNFQAPGSLRPFKVSLLTQAIKKKNRCNNTCSLVCRLYNSINKAKYNQSILLY